jgi:hypothetical protein
MYRRSQLGPDAWTACGLQERKSDGYMIALLLCHGLTAMTGSREYLITRYPAKLLRQQSNDPIVLSTTPA